MANQAGRTPRADVSIGVFLPENVIVDERSKYTMICKTNDREGIFNVWEMNNGSALAHVIGGDATLGKGFAKDLKVNYPKWCPKYQPDPYPVPTVKITQGEAKGLKGTVYHMVAKTKSGVPGCQSPTYEEDLKDCLSAVFSDAIERGIDMVIMPYMVGCGLDGLDPDKMLTWVHGLARDSKVMSVFIKLQ